MKRGILLVSCGDTDCLAALCNKSIIRHSTLPVHVHHDPTKPGLESREVKLRMNELSPFEQTLFLDADTLVCADPAPLFRLLDHAPLWMCMDVGPKTVTEMLAHQFFRAVLKPKSKLALERLAARWPEAPHFNSGVILFDRRCDPFFAAWREFWHALPVGPDQVALALLLGSKRFPLPASLSPRWNFQHSWRRDEADLVSNRQDIRILHLLGPRKPELYRRARAAGYI